MSTYENANNPRKEKSSRQASSFYLQLKEIQASYGRCDSAWGTI